MKYLMICIGFLITFVNPIITTTTYSQTSSDHAYVTDLELALKLSKQTKQKVVVIFSASWCSFCKILKNDMPYLSGFDNKIICILDVDQEKKLAKKFKTKSLPTSIKLNEDGEELDRIIGYEKIPYSKWLELK